MMPMPMPMPMTDPPSVPHPDASTAVREALARHAGEPGALLPILHDVQDELGHIPRHVVPEIANALNLSRAEVHGVVTYYHHFREQPAARHVIQVCRAEACQSMGGEALLAHARQHLGCSAHGTSQDGAFTLEPTYCLGLCASSPAMLFDDAPHARVTPRVFDSLVALARSGA
jgi:formate dehydrogenase subunit gamma